MIDYAEIQAQVEEMTPGQKNYILAYAIQVRPEMIKWIIEDAKKTSEWERI